MYQLKSLGGVSILDAGGHAVRLRSRKHLALLLFLVSHHDRVFTRSFLSSLLWDTAPERARHSLSQAIYDLRMRLGGAVEQNGAEELRLVRGLIVFDVTEMETAVKGGRLGHAVELYSGPFAPNLEETGTPDFRRWVESERVRLGRLAQMTTRRLITECDSGARWGEICVVALKLIELDSLDEDAHQDLMRALWLHGGSQSALRHFTEVEAHLEAELPNGISESTRELVAQIEAAPQRSSDRGGDVNPPMLGREEEFVFLRETVRGIRNSRARSVVILGEAGIGKTRLLKELRLVLDLEPVSVIESRCYPAESSIPYGPVVEAIRQIATDVAARIPVNSANFGRIGQLLPEFEHLIRPEADSGIDPAAWKRRLYEEVVEFLRIATSIRPLVWILEDAQWIDSTSASLLHYLTRRLDEDQFLLLITQRVPRGGVLPARLAVSLPAAADKTVPLSLSPLPPERVEELLLFIKPEAKGHPAVELAQRLSGGNPFFAMEVFHAATQSESWTSEAWFWDPLTDARLSQVLAVRFRELSDSANRLLQAVAVLERHATPRLVSRLAGVPLDEAAHHSDELYGRGLLHDAADRIEFVNDITREYVYSELNLVQRTRLHRTTGALLADEYGTSNATIARHFHLGDAREKTYEYSILAAREASASGGHREAAGMAELARRAARSRDQIVDALTVLSDSQLLCGQLQAAKISYLDLLDLQTDMPPKRRVEIKLRVVEALAEASDWETGIATVGEVDQLIETCLDGEALFESRAEAIHWRLKIVIRQGDGSTARALYKALAALLEEARGAGHLTNATRASVTCSRAAYESFFESSRMAVETLSAASELSVGHVPERLVERLMLLRGMASLRIANWDQGEVALRKALEIALKRNDLVKLYGLWNNLACSALEQGDWMRFGARAEEAEKIASELPGPIDATLPMLLNNANSLFYQGKSRDALGLYSRAFEMANETGSDEFLPELLACRGLTSLQLGLYREAGSILGELDALDADSNTGAQERFKVEWFSAFMNRSVNRDQAKQRIIHAAADHADLDYPSHLKLLVLAQLLFKDAAADETAVREQVSAAGLAWFPRFANRWLRSASVVRNG